MIARTIGLRIGYVCVYEFCSCVLFVTTCGVSWSMYLMHDESACVFF
jgi:hypothetical protein